MCFFIFLLKVALRKFVTRYRGSIRGIDSTSATARLPSRYRGCTGYRGLRYRGLLVHSHCNGRKRIELKRMQRIELKRCGGKDEDEADDEDDEDEADETRRGRGRSRRGGLGG